MKRAARCLAALAVFALVGTALAGPETWFKSLEDGLDASRASGKPVLAITTWADGV